MKKLISFLLCGLAALSLAIPASAGCPEDRVAVANGVLYVPSVYAKDPAPYANAFFDVLWLSQICESTNITLKHRADDGFTTGDVVIADNASLTIEVPDFSEVIVDDYGTVNLTLLQEKLSGLADADVTTAVLDVPDRDALMALRQGPFQFFGWCSLDDTRYRVAAVYPRTSETSIVKMMLDLHVRWTANHVGPYPVSLLGDVDLNGRVTAKDARIALRISAKLEKLPETQFRLADLDFDGKVTAREARKILRVSAGLEKFA